MGSIILHDLIRIFKVTHDKFNKIIARFSKILQVPCTIFARFSMMLAISSKIL